MLLKSLFEMPIQNISMVGNWNKGSSFRHEQDRKLLINPKAQAKIINKWSKTPFPFNMYFVNTPEAGRHTEIGEVSQGWLDVNMNTFLKDYKKDHDAINVIYTNNNGSERVPMTAWTIAHRFGHAVRNTEEYKTIGKTIHKELLDILKEAFHNILDKPKFGRNYGYSEIEFKMEQKFESMMLSFYHLIGTFKSARDKNIRSVFEFEYELFAQYLTTGNIRFNTLPDSFGYGRKTYGRSDTSAYLKKNEEYDVAVEANESLTILASRLVDLFEDLLLNLVGKTFVM